MTDEEKAARLLFPGFRFGKNDPTEATALANLGVGGFCLYQGRANGIAKLTSDLQEKTGGRLLFCADYENGVASHCPDGTALMSNMGLGAADLENLAFEKGAITAREARAMGVRWILTPVVDLATRSDNPIVNTRAFSADPDKVSRLAGAFMKGLSSEGALGCLKHFPGHGDTGVDSHLELPSIDASKELMLNREIVPFRKLALQAESVMLAHLDVPALITEKGIPSSLSSEIVRLLREDLKFTGLVVTDALEMGALAKRFDEVQAAVMALKAGADVLLVPARPLEIIKGLQRELAQDKVLRARVAESFARLEAALAKLASFRGTEKNDLGIVGAPKHRAAAQKMAEACLAWVAEPASLSPADAVRYWEIGVPPSGPWKGDAFLDELQVDGLRICRDHEIKKGDTLVIGSFLTPRAYAGRIRCDPQEAELIRRAIAKAGRAVMASFGSPFVFEDFAVPGLCAFSANEDSQQACARALLGQIPIKGRMPVDLRRQYKR